MLRLIWIFFLFIPVLLSAQKDSTTLSEINYDDFGGVVLMDSIVVRASRTGFDVQDFIGMVQKDESFYKAFRNIRRLSYSAENEIRFYSKKRKQKARYFSTSTQHFQDDCRTMTFANESISGNYLKRKKKLRYYTAKMYDQLFFVHDKVCQPADATDDPPAPKKGMEKHIQELKKLIFSPGEKVDVPVIGKKTAIFSKKMAKYYDYSITSKKYKNKVDCYVFSAEVKPKFQKKKKDKTVIKTLRTYFEKSSLQVVARVYDLQYYGALFDFDISMRIELRKIGELYVPEYLEYNGFWNIPAKKPEIANFHAKFYDYQLN